jgi:hypothetical protein
VGKLLEQYGIQVLYTTRDAIVPDLSGICLIFGHLPDFSPDFLWMPDFA